MIRVTDTVSIPFTKHNNPDYKSTSFNAYLITQTYPNEPTTNYSTTSAGDQHTKSTKRT